jgi:hypothetical protein
MERIGRLFRPQRIDERPQHQFVRGHGLRGEKHRRLSLEDSPHGEPGWKAVDPIGERRFVEIPGRLQNRFTSGVEHCRPIRHCQPARTRPAYR